MKKKQSEQRKTMSKEETHKVSLAFGKHFFKQRVAKENETPLGVMRETPPDWKPTLQDAHDELLANIPTFSKKTEKAQ